MRLQEFIEAHQHLDGYGDLHNKDGVHVLDVVEFVRRQGLAVRDDSDLLRVVQDEVGGSDRAFLEHPARTAALQLWGLYICADLASAKTSERRDIGLRPRRKIL